LKSNIPLEKATLKMAKVITYELEDDDVYATGLMMIILIIKDIEAEASL
jgi:hypothetical protein